MKNALDVITAFAKSHNGFTMPTTGFWSTNVLHSTLFASQALNYTFFSIAITVKQQPSLCATERT